MEMNNSKPLITTIIPTYRRPELLRRAIKSVLNQTYPYFQVCVYDNASGDETAEVVAEFTKMDSRIKYHCHPENIGALANFNYGMERVETPFFSFLSDDDILLPDFYEKVLIGFEKYPEAIFSAVGCIFIDHRGKASITEWEPGFYQPPDGLIAMLKNGHPTWTGIVFRKEVIEKVGILDPMIVNMDLDYELRVVAHCPFVISMEPGAVFVSYYSHKKADVAFSSWLKIINKLITDKQIPSNIRVYAEQLLIKRVKRRILLVSFNSITHKDYERILNISKIFNKHHRFNGVIFFISNAARFCRLFPVARYFFVFVLCFFAFVYHLPVLLNKFLKFFRSVRRL